MGSTAHLQCPMLLKQNMWGPVKTKYLICQLLYGSPFLVHPKTVSCSHVHDPLFIRQRQFPIEHFRCALLTASLNQTASMHICCGLAFCQPWLYQHSPGMTSIMINQDGLDRLISCHQAWHRSQSISHHQQWSQIWCFRQYVSQTRRSLHWYKGKQTLVL